MISLEAANLSKVYRIYQRPIDSLKELILRRSFHDDFWALRGIDFALPRGGSLGIIGENGAGKSTLLAVNRTLWLKGGTTEMLGATIEVTDCYQDYQPGSRRESDSGSLRPPAVDRKETFIGEPSISS